MKKIEERYKCTQEACSNKCPLYHPDAKICLQHWAIKFATEQKAIDDKVAFEEREKAFKAGYDTAIDKACEWWLNNLPTPAWWGSTEEFVAEFTKAMEDEI